MRPKLKKPNSDLIFKNFRPLLSKLAEKTVVHQTVDHMNYHELFPEFQSAYRLNHSTETALLRVRNDLLMNTNSQSATLLVFLDLSAAFDTNDHAILLRRLQTKFGFTGKTLAWFNSYLTGRFQHVVIENVRSNRFDLEFGVPQGSCLVLFCFRFIQVSCLTLFQNTYQMYTVMQMTLNCTCRSNLTTKQAN